MKKICLFLLILSLFTIVIKGDNNLTIYNGNYGLYNETFTIDLKKGTENYHLKKVPTKIDTGSIIFKPKRYSNYIEILEQNYDYDLVNMSKLINKLLGTNVEFITKNGKKFTGKLVSTYSNNILLEKNDKYISLDTDEIRKFLFNNETNLIIEPTLSWMIDSRVNRNVKFDISYLMNDINWHAKYNLNLNDDEDEGILNSWIMLTNNSGKKFNNVKLQLMAGEVQKIKKRRDYSKMVKARMESASRQSVSEEKISEFHLYTVERPVSINNNQNKEITLFNPVKIDVDKKLTYNISKNNKNVSVAYEFKNSKNNNLGIALPGGKFSVYKKDKRDNTQFLGEDKLNHTPRNENISIKIGTAFDVLGNTKLISRKKIKRDTYLLEYKVHLKNRKKERVELSAIYHKNNRIKFVKSTEDVDNKKSDKLRFNFKLSPNEEKIFTFTVKQVY